MIIRYIALVLPKKASERYLVNECQGTPCEGLGTNMPQKRPKSSHCPKQIDAKKTATGTLLKKITTSGQGVGSHKQGWGDHEVNRNLGLKIG